jgi:hypothetical protein
VGAVISVFTQKNKLNIHSNLLGNEGSQGGKSTNSSEEHAVDSSKTSTIFLS